MDPAVFPGIWSKPLLLAHLAASVALIGASFHHFFLTFHLARGRVVKPAAARRYALYIPILCFFCAALGAAVYPQFRMSVREGYFDRSLPWATGVFEIKEWLAAADAAAVLALCAIGRAINPQRDAWLAGPYFSLSAVNLAVVLFAATAGAALVMHRSV